MIRLLAILLLAQPVSADSVVATRTIRAKSLIGAEDLTVVSAEVPGAMTDPAQAIGLEARVAIYAGKPLRASDIGTPTLITRNQIVPLIYLWGGLAISTEGRSLGQGAAGEVIRVINLGSRTTVSGRVGTDGSVYVGTEN